MIDKILLHVPRDSSRSVLRRVWLDMASFANSALARWAYCTKAQDCTHMKVAGANAAKNWREAWKTRVKSRVNDEVAWYALLVVENIY